RLVAAGIAIPAVILGIVGLAEPFITDTEWFSSLGYHIDRIKPIRYAGYALMSGGFLTIWYLYKKKNTRWAIETLSLTVLALVFVAGLAIRSFNADIGYKAISDEVAAMKKDNPDAEVMTWKIDRPENIDAYLQKTPFRIVESADSMKAMPISSYPALVMTRQDCLYEVPDVMEIHRLGQKYVVLYCDTTETKEP
ncbi:MAG: hypothetical protein K2L11_08745, partial [Muribaculaceae bacterium]|nr:hypothetical protein [Muribaculaceae bacterium]